MKKIKLPQSYYPSEHQENLNFIARCGLLRKKYPVLRELMHLSNEGKRGWIGQAIFKAIKQYLGKYLNGKLIGQAGVHDWHLPVRDYEEQYFTLYIEMKKQRGAYGTDKAADKAYSEEQRAWANRMEALGHKCCVAYGAEEAAKAVEEYLGL